MVSVVTRISQGIKTSPGAQSGAVCFAIYLERDPISHKQNVPPLLQSAKHASDLESATCVNNLLINLTVVMSAVAADSTERDLISHALFRTCFYRVFWKVPFETPLLCCFHEKIL